MLDREEKREIVTKQQRHTFDTGSPEIQIALLTARILYLMDHLKGNKHDHSCIRGLQKLVAKRKKLLAYLHKENPSRYAALIQELRIRG